MDFREKVGAVNLVVQQYFKRHPGETILPAKELMPEFIEQNIFPKDHRNGLPIRNLLRQLDKTNQLESIPFAYPERRSANTNWYFVPSAKAFDSEELFKPKKTLKKNSKSVSRRDSDEIYVIDLCDEILRQVAFRQHKFDFLRGDSGRRLPVDAYYEYLNLVIEYRERQHSEAVSHFDKPHNMTVSGVHRGEQRKIYDQRKRDLLPVNGIKLIEIDYTQFEYDGRKRIVRDRERDLGILKTILTNIKKTN